MISRPDGRGTPGTYPPRGGTPGPAAAGRRAAQAFGAKPRHAGRPWERIRKRVIGSSDVCALCGQPVDKSRKYPDLMSPSVDLIVPLVHGGSWRDEANLQLAHLWCNVSAGDKGPRRRTTAFRRSQEW